MWFVGGCVLSFGSSKVKREKDPKRVSMAEIGGVGLVPRQVRESCSSSDLDTTTIVSHKLSSSPLSQLTTPVRPHANPARAIFFGGASCVD